MNNESELKIQRVLELFAAGNDKHEISKILGYKDYKGLQAYMKRHQYIWNENIQNYQIFNEYSKQVKTQRILMEKESNTTGKAASIISMFEKGMDSRTIAKKLNFENHQEMAAYMKVRGYVWDVENENYKRDGSTTIGIKSNATNDTIKEIEENAVAIQEESALGKYTDILNLLSCNKEKLINLLTSESNDTREMSRYTISGLAITKSVHMISKLDQLIREYSKENNISQRDMFQIAMIEFFKKYGYKQEIEALLGR